MLGVVDAAGWAVPSFVARRRRRRYSTTPVRANSIAGVDHRDDLNSSLVRGEFGRVRCSREQNRPSQWHRARLGNLSVSIRVKHCDGPAAAHRIESVGRLRHYSQDIAFFALSSLLHPV